MAATSVQTVMPESEISAANAEEHTIQTTVAAAGTSKTQIGRVVGVLAGVLAVVTLGASPMLLATGKHLRKDATEPRMLHSRAHGSLPHEDCSQIGCCAQPGHQCYKKDDHWAGCRASCTPGKTWEGDDWKHRTPWSCELIDPDNCGRGKLPPAQTHENCWQRDGRCAERGHQCYKKNDHWAACRASCTPGIWKDDHWKYRTPWSCEPVGSRFPERTHLAVNNNGLMEGLCLAESGRGEPVRFVQCARRHMAWNTRGDFGNFDLWFSSGQARDYGAAIRPAHCPQSVAEGSTANAEDRGMCKNGWGLKRNGRETDFKIELTKDGSAYGLCLTSAEMREGDHAIWMPCAHHGLSFRAW